jgi:hypothetical protein
VTGLWLAATAAQGSQRPLDQVNVTPRADVLELSWSDAEERLQGSISPVVPREGQPLQISLQVNRFEGDPYEGPVTLTLREAGATHGQSVTVQRGPRHWQATFTPEKSGPHLLDVSFRSTRFKVVHAPLQVEGSLVPRLLGWAVLGLGTLALLGYSVRNLLRAGRAEEGAPVEAPAEAAPSPPAPAPADPPAPAEGKPEEKSEEKSPPSQ